MESDKEDKKYRLKPRVIEETMEPGKKIFYRPFDIRLKLIPIPERRDTSLF